MRLRAAAICVVVLTALSAVRPAAPADAMLKQAESTAVRYMKALFSAHMSTVVALTHPDVLRRFGRQFNASLERAAAQGRAAEFLHRNGLDITPDEARSLPVARLYAAVLKANNLRAPKEYRERMKRVDIKVARGRLEGDRRALVKLQIGPAQDPRTGTLELKLENDRWLIAGSGKKF